MITKRVQLHFFTQNVDFNILKSIKLIVQVETNEQKVIEKNVLTVPFYPKKLKYKELDDRLVFKIKTPKKVLGVGCTTFRKVITSPMIPYVYIVSVSEEVPSQVLEIHFFTSKSKRKKRGTINSNREKLEFSNDQSMDEALSPVGSGNGQFQSNLEKVMNLELDGNKYTGTVIIASNRAKFPHAKKGKMIYKNSGIIYEGGFTNGSKVCDRAKISYQDGTQLYVAYKNDTPFGMVNIFFSNGDEYDGHFYYRPPKSKKACGLEFDSFILNGFGTLFVKNQNTLYVGTFKNSKRNGIGFMENLTNGERYIGFWKNGIIHGEGTLTSIDGTIFDGNFNSGNKTGNGRMIFSNGYDISGVWDKKKIKSIQIGDDFENYDLNTLQLLKKHVLGLIDENPISINDNIYGNNIGNVGTQKITKNVERMITKEFYRWRTFLNLKEFEEQVDSLIKTQVQINEDFFKKLLNQRKYIKQMVDLFCYFLNKTYSCEHFQKKKDLIYIKTDIITFVDYLQKVFMYTVSKILNGMKEKPECTVSPHKLKEILIDKITNISYDVLFDYYLENLNSKEIKLEQKIRSIKMAVKQLSDKKKMWYLKEHFQLVEKEKKKKIPEIDKMLVSTLLNLINKTILDNEKEKIVIEKEIKDKTRPIRPPKPRSLTHRSLRISSSDLQKDVMYVRNPKKPEKTVANIFGSSINALNQVLEKKLEMLFSECDESLVIQLKKVIKRYRLKFSFSPSHFLSKSFVSKTRENYRCFRISFFSSYYVNIMNVISKTLKNFFREGKIKDECYLLDNLEYLSEGFTWLKDSEIPENVSLMRIDKDYVKCLLSAFKSLELSIDSYFTRSYEQMIYIRKSIDLRIESIIKGLRILSKMTPKKEKKHIYQELEKQFLTLNQGTEKIKQNKVKIIVSEFQKLTQDIENSRRDKSKSTTRLLFDSVYFRFMSIVDLIYKDIFPIPISLNVKNTNIEIESLLFFLDFLAKDETCKKYYYVLFHSFKVVCKNISSKLLDNVTKMSNENDVDVFMFLVLEKEKISNITQILEQIMMIPIPGGEVVHGFEFFFEVLNIINAGFHQFKRNLFKMEYPYMLKDRAKKLDNKPPLQKLYKRTLRYITNLSGLEGLKIIEQIEVLETLLKVVELKLEIADFKQKRRLYFNDFLEGDFSKSLLKLETKIRTKKNNLILKSIEIGQRCFISKQMKFDNSVYYLSECLKPLGINEKFVPKQIALNRVPYHLSIAKLDTLGEMDSIPEMLNVFKEFNLILDEEMKKISGKKPPFEEDEKLPIVLYCLLLSKNLHHYATHQILVDFCNTRQTVMLVRYMTFINYIESLDVYARFEGKLLTIVGNIINPIKSFLKKRMNNFQSLKQEFGLEWLINLLNIIYCEIGFIDNDTNILKLNEESMVSNERIRKGKKKSEKQNIWEYLKYNQHTLNPILVNIGFSIKFDPVENVIEVEFKKRYSPEIYKKIIQSLSKEFLNKKY